MTYSAEKKHREYLQIGQNLEDENTLAFIEQFYADDDKSGIHRKAMMFLKMALKEQEKAEKEKDLTMPDKLAGLLKAIQTNSCLPELSAHSIWFMYIATKEYLELNNINLKSESFEPRYLDGKLVTNDRELLATTVSLKDYCDSRTNEKCEEYKKAIMRQVAENERKLYDRIAALEKIILEKDLEMPNLVKLSLNKEII